MPADSPALSVIVPAEEGSATLPQCGEALTRALGPDDELIVIERPSLGFPGHKRNLGARRASRPVLVFIDSDVVIHSDALDRMRSAFAEGPDLDAVFGAYDTTPAPEGLVAVFRNLLHHHVHAVEAGPAQTFWTGIGAIRRETFERAGGFDPRLRALEDVELGMRLVDAGHRIVLDPAIAGRHLKTWSLSGMVLTDLFHRSIPWTRLLLERHTAPAILNLGWRHRLSAACLVACGGASAARRPVAAAGSAATFVALNGRLYQLLAERGGPRLAGAGVPLHALHHLTGMTGLALGTAAHMVAPRTPRTHALGALDVEPSPEHTEAPPTRRSPRRVNHRVSSRASNGRVPALASAEAGPERRLD